MTNFLFVFFFGTPIVAAAVGVVKIRRAELRAARAVKRIHEARIEEFRPDGD